MSNSRRWQLTLFVTHQNDIIERIRLAYNPIQFNLIAAHVTLCREDELDMLEKIIENLQSIRLSRSIKIEFNAVKRFSEGKGVLIPAKKSNVEFDELRKLVLKGITDLPNVQHAHITLMHPRNSTCTDSIFKQIKEFKLPTELNFDEVALIEQSRGGERWKVVRRFPIKH